MGEEEDTHEEVYVPYLFQQGFIVKTPRGRKPMELAFKHLGAIADEEAETQGSLF